MFVRDSTWRTRGSHEAAQHQHQQRSLTLTPLRQDTGSPQYVASRSSVRAGAMLTPHETLRCVCVSLLEGPRHAAQLLATAPAGRALHRPWRSDAAWSLCRGSSSHISGSSMRGSGGARIVCHAKRGSAKASGPRTVYVCSDCGHEHSKFQGATSHEPTHAPAMCACYLPRLYPGPIIVQLVVLTGRRYARSPAC